ncbi:MAG: tRNA 2-thiouridine(34) synthase MnmA [Phycisphaeraceae bacterium]|nr:tRNA 2-thiouridine(34) synthase MnmA [Phycisphaeraceae bacterium]
MVARRGKILVAMSGGVDSSVAAAKLVRAGYDVIGCFMRLGTPEDSGEGLRPYEEVRDGRVCESRIRLPQKAPRGCCSVSDAADAKAVAAELGIPLYVCNFRREFGRVMEYFVDEYAAGRTPNPCVRCNDWLKFGRLHEYARQLDCVAVASGHYARVERGDDGQPRLLRGIDASKDQSYVLFGVARELLASMMLPVGGMYKTELREEARALGLPVFDKPDSQEICFVPDDDYAGLVARRRPEAARPGAIVDPQGKVLGQHDGQHQFTIGQRRGLGVASSEPMFVLAKDPVANTVTVGPRNLLGASGCTAAEANWLCARPEGEKDDGAWFRCLAKYRYNGGQVLAEARRLQDEIPGGPSGRTGAFEVRFESPQEAVAPGQAIVLYGEANREVVLGGGWITRTA